MKSLCLFVSYVGNGNHKKDYPMIVDLEKIFDSVIVLTDKKMSEDLHVKFTNIVYKNEGYDFGFWYKALNELDLGQYSQIALINNSNALLPGKSLRPIFKWAQDKSFDYWGVTDSHEAPRGVDPNKSHHIQSHFLVFEKAAIPYIMPFFKSVNFERFFKITNQPKLRQSIINECEIGMSQYMINKGLSIGSRFTVKKFVAKVSNRNWKNTNMHVWLWEELIIKGYPLIKKKILRGEWGFLPNKNNYKSYI